MVHLVKFSHLGKKSTNKNVEGGILRKIQYFTGNSMLEDDNS